MAQVEVYLKTGITEDEKHLITADFGFAPRIGDTISIMREDFFTYYSVVEAWHRQNNEGEAFVYCVEVIIDD